MEYHSDSNQGVGSELMTDAKGVGTSAVNRLHSEVEARKGDAATQVVAVSLAIERAAGELDDNAPSWLKPALEKGAKQIQLLANSIEQKDSRQLAGEISDFARGSPGTFLSVCAAAGFAAARVFKAGNSENTPTRLEAINPDDLTADIYPPNIPGSNNLSPNAKVDQFA